MWEPLFLELVEAAVIERSFAAARPAVRPPRRRGPGSPIRRCLAARLAAIAALIHPEAARSALLLRA
jgi:hypothetical protein